MVDKKIRIECLLCGGVLKIPSLINTEQYDGLGICQKCQSEIHVKLSKGKLTKYEVLEKKTMPITTIIEHYNETKEDRDIENDKEI